MSATLKQSGNKAVITLEGELTLPFAEELKGIFMNDTSQSGPSDSVEKIVKELRITFREEAFELLAELESGLLELEKYPDDKERIGRVFRALHTLKGSGGACEFHEIVAFTQCGGLYQGNEPRQPAERIAQAWHVHSVGADD